jgi:hypothetical protein
LLICRFVDLLIDWLISGVVDLLEAAGAVDAQNASTAPWKTKMTGFPQLPQGIIFISTLGADRMR